MEENLKRFKGKYLKEECKVVKDKPKGNSLIHKGGLGSLDYGCRKILRKGISL